MSLNLSKVVLFVQTIINLIVIRNYGNIIRDVVQNNNGQLSVKKLRKMEKLYVKLDKSKLDISFLTNCKKFSVVPKFLYFNLPYTNNNDAKAFRRRLLRSALRKRYKEKLQIELEVEKLCREIRSIVGGLEWYMLYKSIQKNVIIKRNKVIEIHEKKLMNLTHNKTLPFQHKDVVTNLSSYNLTPEELDILTFGLSYGIPPNKLNRTDIFTTFDMIHRFLSGELYDNGNKNALTADLSQLANSYYSNYKPTKNTLKKHGILKKLKNNKNIIITSPDKGNGVVVMDRMLYVSKMYELINDDSKFKKLEADPTLCREGQLQRYLRKLQKNKNCFSKEIYNKIYPTGSQPSRLYGLPKLHKVKCVSTFLRLDQLYHL